MKQECKDFLNRAAVVLIVIAFVAASATAFIGYAAGSLTAILIGLAPSVGLTVWGILFFVRMLGEKASEESDFDRLIRTGEKIRVDLGRIAIRSSIQHEEIIKGSGVLLNTDVLESCHNFLTLDITHRGKSLHWETMLDMEPDLLRIRLLVQGHTDLYYDPKSGMMHMDLGFLGRS